MSIKNSTNQTIVPDREVDFGAGQALPASNAQARPQNTEAHDKTAGKTVRMCQEGRHTLELISEAFIIAADTDKRFYHKLSGDRMGEQGFKDFCGEHYGDVELATEDKDGNATSNRVNSGELWGNTRYRIEGRRVVRRIVMEPTRIPEEDGDREVYNRWYLLKEREMVPPHPSATSGDIGIFLNHLMYISDGDQQGVMYFLCWLAQLYQTPEIKLPTAILFYSKYGRVGKTMLWKLLKEVFGRSMVGSCTGANLQKAFDDVTEHKRILFVNEMAKSDKADGYERFKNQISEEQVSFEGKGRAARDIRNITHYIVTTNNNDALPLMDNDGRVLVLRCLAERKEDAYYKVLHDWMEGPGPELLAGVLSRWQFPANWDPHAPVPQTEASRAMQRAARGDLADLVEDLIERGVGPFSADFGTVGDLCAMLNGDESLRVQVSKGINRTTLGLALRPRCGEPKKTRVKRNGKDENLNLVFWRNRDHWENVATPEQRGGHLNHPGMRVIPGVQGGADHGRA